MKSIFRIVKILAALVGLLVVGLGVLLFLTFSGGKPIQDGQRLNGVEVVKDGMVAAYIVDIDDGSVALIDAGNDSEAKAILLALARRNLSPSAVKDILLTHGDRDHTGGALKFPQATIMALEPDVALAEGRAVKPLFKLFASPHPSGLKVGRVLHDGETVTLGTLAVRVWAVPGHTPGSVAYVTRGVLFMGDSAEATKEGKLTAAKRLFSESPAQNRASLYQLARQLHPWAGDVKAIAFGHSGVLTRGLVPLTQFAAND